jgi:Transposase IS116/IS110/IS902 family
VRRTSTQAVVRSSSTTARAINGGRSRWTVGHGRTYRELTELVAAHHPNLLVEQGAGALTAAILIGHTAGNQQFCKEASFAMKTGTPPVPCSSGQRTQHRLNRGGDRQLNHALHIIAITRAQRDPATKQYLARKQAEGKTSKGALRSLKRHLARRFHRLLAEPPADQQQATNGQSTVEPQPVDSNDQPPEIPPPPPRRREVQRIDAAPALMVCITYSEPPRPSAPFSGPLPPRRTLAAATACRKSTRSSPIGRSPTPSRAFSAHLRPSTDHPRPTTPRSGATPAPKPANPAMTDSAQKPANSDRLLT